MADPDADYVCSLDEKSLKVAKEELCEDPDERLSQVKQLRAWIETQPHLKCKTDTIFLLNFLRRYRFSQLETRKMLDYFLTILTEMPEWFRDLDPLEPHIEKAYWTGHLVPLPQRDDKGRRVVLMRPGVIDPNTKEFTGMHVSKDNNCIFGVLQGEEMTQVNGMIFVIDYTGMTTKHMSFYGMDQARKMSKFMDKFPGRFKEMHYYNTGSVFEAVMGVMKPFLSQKIKDRMIMHGNNLESLYKKIPLHLLPEEYLPDDYTGPNAGSVKTILEDFRKRMIEPKFRNGLIEGSTEYGYVDERLRPKVEEVQATFRKLNVD
ncbi:unnamed protein product [Owenia fusiformis]|uniref:Uncharacterized protein n=1 Tax=Owenia fusiformis TaxID=6347 RepID=A0A8J1UG92_OWEFU|nr:unnamed protein product [Owenia fusiformis]